MGKKQDAKDARKQAKKAKADARAAAEPAFREQALAEYVAITASDPRPVDAEPIPDVEEVLPTGLARGPRRLLDRLSGAKLCYAKPVTVGERTVIPVARVRSASGWRQVGGEPTGAALEARPVGFIEITEDGTRFESIEAPRQSMPPAAIGLSLLLAFSLGLRSRGARR